MKVVKISKKHMMVVTLIIAMITFISTSVLAVNPNDYKPNDVGTPSLFYSRVGIVLGWIKYIGILVAVVALTIIGIRYLFSSVEGKAEYKKTMMPYVLGCFLLVATSTIVGLIADVADTTVKPDYTTTCTWYEEDNCIVVCDSCGEMCFMATEKELEKLIGRYCDHCGKTIRDITKVYSSVELDYDE